MLPVIIWMAATFVWRVAVADLGRAGAVGVVR